MIVARALLPEVEVVGHQLADVPTVVVKRVVGLARNAARQIVIVVFQRAPPPPRELKPAGVEIAPGGHAGMRAAPRLVEDGGAGCEAVHVGRRDNPVGLIGIAERAH